MILRPSSFDSHKVLFRERDIVQIQIAEPREWNLELIPFLNGRLGIVRGVDVDTSVDYGRQKGQRPNRYDVFFGEAVRCPSREGELWGVQLEEHNLRKHDVIDVESARLRKALDDLITERNVPPPAPAPAPRPEYETAMTYADLSFAMRNGITRPDGEGWRLHTANVTTAYMIWHWEREAR
jgi:hypothetical protein